MSKYQTKKNQYEPPKYYIVTLIVLQDLEEKRYYLAEFLYGVRVWHVYDCGESVAPRIVIKQILPSQQFHKLYPANKRLIVIVKKNAQYKIQWCCADNCVWLMLKSKSGVLMSADPPLLSNIFGKYCIAYICM